MTAQKYNRTETEQKDNITERQHNRKWFNLKYRNQVILHYCNVVIFYNKQAFRVLKRKRFHFGTENLKYMNYVILHYCNIVLFNSIKTLRVPEYQKESVSIILLQYYIIVISHCCNIVM